MLFRSSIMSVAEQPAGAYGVLRALLTRRGADDRGLAGGMSAPYFHAVRCDAVLRALADEAEYHGVAALIEPMISALSGTQPDIVPEDVRRTFAALASRHRRAAAAREQCIDELLTAFAQANIPIILLKGAALAHLIYPGPALRAMVDVDVLVAADDTARAVATCRDLGFSFAAHYGSRFAGRLHHLPAATTERSGFRISLEIHTDTMSPDQADSLTVATLTEEPQRFRRSSGPDGVALGHTDMLRHLARHAFEPARRIRLIHLYDLWRYQRLLDGKIDWADVAARFPEVMTALRLVSYVFADQRLAADPCGPGREPVPSGLGLGMVPLSEIATMDGLAAKLAALFNPPAWWLHGFYAVPPDRSLLYCRTIRHPTTVARWFTRRLLAGLGHARANRRPGDHGVGVAGIES
jgi:hypothetical protein